MAGALSGVLVVALEQAVAAPLCTARLAAAGARVIKIERAEGDFARGYDAVVAGESAYFVWLNQGKESLVLDIKQPDDAALLARILAQADVFVQNLAPGAAARAGFGAAVLRVRHPRLITCDITGYGTGGPYRDMKAYDLLIQCETGLAAITGAPEAAGRVGVSVADIACGMNAHAAILEALIARGQTGVGRELAVSLFDAIADWMTVPLLHHDYGGNAPARLGLAHPSIAPYGAFATADGRQIVLAVQNEREWRSLALALLPAGVADDPRFAANSLRVADRPAVDGLMATALGALDSGAALAVLKAAGIAHGAVNEVADLACHPQLRRHTVLAGHGLVSLPAAAVQVAGAVPAPGQVPGLGAHSAAIRAEFGGA
ncbi:MAG: CaiB/BaiF CoA transferase family protein [Polymorphobacter sp.]